MHFVWLPRNEKRKTKNEKEYNILLNQTTKLTVIDLYTISILFWKVPGIAILHSH